MQAPTALKMILRCVSCLSASLLLACAGDDGAPPASGPGPAADPSGSAAADGGNAGMEPEVVALLMDFDSSELPDYLETDGANVRRVATVDSGVNDDGDGGDSDGSIESVGEGQGEDQAGDGALEIVFSASAYEPTVRFRPEMPWDWSDLADVHLAIDASNAGDESVQLYMALTDALGATTNRSVNIAVGETNTYYFVVEGPSIELDSGLRENPPAWVSSDEMFIYRRSEKELDLSAVAEIALSAKGILVDKRVVVDNFRLRRNPEHDLSYLEGIVDEFGQNAMEDFPIKVHSEAELVEAAEAELAALAASEPLPDRSRFGGWLDGPQREATGYFRAEKVNGKWWLVDPDGYLFFSNGIANVRVANLTTLTGIDFSDPSVRAVDPEEVTPEDSIGIVEVTDDARQTRYVSSTLRRNLFAWLPDYDHALADHYSYRRTALRGPLDGGETFSFYRANLERRYGETEPESYLRKWEEVTLQRFLDWGFTSMGNWVDPAFYPNELVPYFANGWIIGEFNTLHSPVDVWAPMPDPFDPEFVRRAQITVEVIAEEIQGSPWCIGVFVDNEKSWGFREGTVEQRYGLILNALSHSAEESPAKRAFTERLRETHGSLEAINARWGTEIASWAEFEAGMSFSEPAGNTAVVQSGDAFADYTGEAIADFSMLLAMLAEEYFRVVHDALATALPNHLYMGVRMANWGMPDETIQAAVKYTDVLSFNIYEEGLQPHRWEFLDEIDLPAIDGEWHIGSTRETGLFHPGLVSADGQADRAAMYKAYLESVLAQDTMVGAHFFQYVDSPITGRAFDGENYNVGFVGVTDIPYPEMVEAVKEVNAELYPGRYGGSP